jgi:hypothetical protein
VLAALVLALAAAGAAADELGTLFFTAEERARLDKLRRGEPTEQVSGPSARTQRALTGFVQRSDGRTTVWIDGNAVPLNSPRSKLDPKAVQAYSPGDDVKVERKPAR